MSIGRLRRQKGDSDGARKIYEEALAVCRQPGEKGEVAAVQVALGELDCDIGQTAEAQTLARLAIEEFRAEREPDPEIQSEALLSWSLLQQGKLDDAEAAMLPCCLFCCACFFRDKLETLWNARFFPFLQACLRPRSGLRISQAIAPRRNVRRLLKPAQNPSTARLFRRVLLPRGLHARQNAYA